MLANRVVMGSNIAKSDWSGTKNRDFRYIGTETTVEIPHIINGVAVTSYGNMFNSASGKLVKKVISTNTNITETYSMFLGSQATTLDVSLLNMSNVVDANGMFQDSQAITINMSGWNTSNFTGTSFMFAGTKATTLNLLHFNTSNVVYMSGMFWGSNATTLDLSSFNTSNVTVANMHIMFRDSKATIGYAKTIADRDKFNSSSQKPVGLVFVVK